MSLRAHLKAFRAKIMYKKQKPTSSNLTAGTLQSGETIEQRIERITNNGEPITDGSPIIYSERKDGVLPEYNPRTDRWDIAAEAMNVASKTHLAKRDNVIKMEPKGDKKDGGAEPIQGTPEPSKD